MNQLISKLLICIMILQISGLTALAQQQLPDQISNSNRTASIPQLARSIEATESLAQELEQAKENDFPKTPPKDTFRLTHQTLIEDPEGTQQFFELSKLNLKLPEHIITDREKELSISVHPQTGSLEILKTKNGKVLAKHIIPNLQVVQWVMDRDFLVLVLKSGDVVAMDSNTIGDLAFKAPIPLVPLVSVPKETPLQEHLTMNFTTRGLRPILDSEIAPHALLPEYIKPGARHDERFGDLVISSGSHEKRIVHAWLSREIIEAQVLTAQTLFNNLAYSINAYEGSEADYLNVAQLAESDKWYQQELGDLDPTLAKVFGSYSKDLIDGIKKRIEKFSAENKSRLRDQATLKEWVEHFDKIQEKARIEIAKTADHEKKAMLQLQEAMQDFSPTWKSLIQDSAPPKPKLFQRIKLLVRKGMRPQALRKIAAYTLGAGALALGFHAVNGEQWTIHLFNQLYDHHFPPVLKDSVYRSTSLLKYFVITSAAIPLTWIIGSIGGKVMKWDFRKWLATVGMRGTSAIIYPWARYVSRLIKSTGHAGNWVLKKTGLPSYKEPTLAEKEVMLEQTNRKRAIANNLAVMVVSQDTGIDPATLSLASLEQVRLEGKQDIKSDPALYRRWRAVALNLLGTLKDMNLSDFDADTLAMMVQDSKKYAEKLKKSVPRSLLAQTKVLWKEASQSFSKGIMNFGLKESQALAKGEPNEFTYRTDWSQFCLDYMTSVAQPALSGPRANPLEPGDLVAQTGAFLGTHPVQLAGIINQYRYSNMNNPSSLFLTFQNNIASREDNYDPVEEILLSRVPRPEKFSEALQSWLKTVVQLHKVDYSSYFIRTQAIYFKTIQISMLFNISTQIIVGDRSPSFAFGIFFFNLFLGNLLTSWQAGPLVKANQVREDNITELNQKLDRAQAIVSQGVRMNSATKVSQGLAELEALIDVTHSKMPEPLQQTLEIASQAFQMSDEERVAFKKDYVAYMGPILRVHNALQKAEDWNELEAAVKDLRSQYAGTPQSDAVKRLNAQALLDYTLQSPPVPNKAHKRFSYYLNFANSTSSMALGIALYTAMMDHYESIGMTKIVAGGILASAAVYGGIALGQKGIDWLAERMKNKKQACERKMTLDDFADIGNSGEAHVQ